MSRLILAFLLTVAANCAMSRPAGDDVPSALAQWTAGQVVSCAAVEAFGMEKCFTEQPIDAKLFRRIDGLSYKKGCTVPLTELRYLKVLHYDLEGQIRTGELICHRTISRDLIEILRTLFDAHYPIERMVLIDNYQADDLRSMEDNNSSAFNFRVIAGTKRLSKHSRGLAIDINPRYNPYVKQSGTKRIVSPKSAAAYADRTADFPYKIDTNDLCYKEFIRHGFIWGGSWINSKDYQHFEK